MQLSKLECLYLFLLLPNKKSLTKSKCCKEHRNKWRKNIVFLYLRRFSLWNLSRKTSVNNLFWPRFFTASKVSVLGVIIVRIFLHSDWIRIQSQYGKIRTRINPNVDTFHAVFGEKILQATVMRCSKK